MGFSLRELFDLDYGEVCDLMIEAANDQATYNYVAQQSDFDSAFT